MSGAEGRITMRRRWIELRSRASTPQPVGSDEIRRAFSDIYQNDKWGGGSGAGSFPEYAGPYVVTLQRFLHDYRIKSVVDLGCGDWQFSRLIDWSGVEYLGLDVVEAVVDANRKEFATDSITFEVTTVGEPLPPADLVVCKDVLQHLPLGVVADYLAEFRQRYKHILITNDVYPDGATNEECLPGAGRAIRLDLEPFSEDCTLILEWDISARGWYWIKHTYHLSGVAGPAVVPPAVRPVLLQRVQTRDAARQV